MTLRITDDLERLTSQQEQELDHDLVIMENALVDLFRRVLQAGNVSSTRLQLHQSEPQPSALRQSQKRRESFGQLVKSISKSSSLPALPFVRYHQLPNGHHVRLGTVAGAWTKSSQESRHLSSFTRLQSIQRQQAPSRQNRS